MDEYFKSDEFKELLTKYESAKEHDIMCYFDDEESVSLSEYFLMNGDCDESMKILESAIDIHPESFNVMFSYANNLVYLHKFLEARSFVDKHLSGDDDQYQDVIYLRAQIIVGLGEDTDTAEEMFREWIEHKKSDYQSMGDDRDVVLREAYTHVISSFVDLTDHEYDPEIVKRWVEEYIVEFSPLGEYDADLSLADIVREENMPDMIVKVYSNILETKPYIKSGWTVLAIAQNAIGKVQESLESCDFALAINPDDWTAKLAKANDYYMLEDWNHAVTLYEEARSKFHDGSISLPYAECLIGSGRSNEALEFLDDARDYADGVVQHADIDAYAFMLHQLAENYYVCGDYTEALKSVNKALSIKSKEPLFHLCRGMITAKMKNLEDAMPDFVEYIDAQENKVDAVFYVGMNLVYNGEEDYAVEIFNTCCDYGDEDVVIEARAYRSFAYFRLHRYEDFLADLKASCEKCPDLIGELYQDILPPNMEPKDYYEFLSAQY